MSQGDLVISTTEQALNLSAASADLSLSTTASDLVLTAANSVLRLSTTVDNSTINLSSVAQDLTLQTAAIDLLMLGPILTTGGGESNTATNIGDGVGLFDSKVGQDLRLRSIRSVTDSIQIIDNPANGTIDIDAPLPAQNIQFAANCAAEISVGDVVRVTSGATIPTVELVDISNYLHFPAAGVVVNKTSATTAMVATAGTVTGLVGLTTGAAVYASATGGLAHALPTSGIIQYCGFAITPTTAIVNIIQPLEI